ncbi:MAG: hypothetical protein IJA20_06050 [Methanocorpusculum sp.]|nr:hypothetical protein [Oscillospiraceae bacterium]MBQ3570222.1 hypothetical protein [Methanocorpusculum sp.]
MTMDYTKLSNSGIADYELGKIEVDYSNGRMLFHMRNRKLQPERLEIDGLEEFRIERREPWGAGIYVTASDYQLCDGKIEIEIQLNSGDMIRIIAAEGCEKT